MTHICVGNLTSIGSDNGLSPGRRQAIIWTNAGILSIGPLGINFSEIFIEILIFPFKKIHLKISSGTWRPFCRGHNVLKCWNFGNIYLHFISFFLVISLSLSLSLSLCLFFVMLNSQYHNSWCPSSAANHHIGSQGIDFVVRECFDLITRKCNSLAPGRLE